MKLSKIKSGDLYCLTGYVTFANENRAYAPIPGTLSNDFISLPLNSPFLILKKRIIKPSMGNVNKIITCVLQILFQKKVYFLNIYGNDLNYLKKLK